MSTKSTGRSPSAAGCPPLGELLKKMYRNQKKTWGNAPVSFFPRKSTFWTFGIFGKLKYFLRLKMDLSLRVTTDMQLEDFCQFLHPLTEKYIVAVEHATKRHMQCYIRYVEEDDLKNSALRYKLGKTFGKGNGNFSLSKMKGDNLKSYCLKESNDIKYKGFSEQEILELKSRSYSKPKSYSEKKKLLGQQYQDSTLNLTQLVVKLLELHTEYSTEYDRFRSQKWVNCQIMKKHRQALIDESVKLIDGLIPENKNLDNSYNQTCHDDTADLESVAEDDDILSVDGLQIKE